MDLLDNILDLFSSTRPADLEWKIMSQFRLSSVPNHHINSLCGIITGMPQAIPGFWQLVFVLRDDKFTRCSRKIFRKRAILYCHMLISVEKHSPIRRVSRVWDSMGCRRALIPICVSIE